MHLASVFRVCSYDVSIRTTKKMAKVLPENVFTSLEMMCHMLCWVQSYFRNESCRTRCMVTSDAIAHKLFSLCHSIDVKSYASIFCRLLNECSIVRTFSFKRPTHSKCMLTNEIKNYS